MGKIQKACDDGKALWCRRLGFWFEEGLSVGRDARRARAYYASACAAGDARACADAGRMIAAGHGGEKDIAQAIGLLKKGCDDAGTGARACGHLGMIYVQREHATDHAEGARLLERACERGDGLACDRLGGFYALGSKGFTKDESLAADRFERACSLAGRACEDAQRMRERIGIE
jgi:hypothetical protein